jgi:uncharacterized membrane protein
VLVHVAPGTPWWLAAAAAPVLIVHISAGGLGILSGATALAVRKGGRLHRQSGTVFVLAMLTMAAMASFLAALIPQRGNVAGGILAFYLILSAWMTVRRRPGGLGRFEYGALAVALACLALFLTFGVMAAGSPRGKLDGYPATLYFIVAAITVFAAGLDLKVLLRGGISGAPRIARHLWRMCLALFIGTGSFFIGQQKVMPQVMHGSPWLYGAALAPLVLMIFWLIRVRFANAFKGGVPPAAGAVG